MSDAENIIDILIQYRAEGLEQVQSQLAAVKASVSGLSRVNESLVQSTGQLLPTTAQQVLVLQKLGTAGDASAASLAKLRQESNLTWQVFSGNVKQNLAGLFKNSQAAAQTFQQISKEMSANQVVVKSLGATMAQTMGTVINPSLLNLQKTAQSTTYTLGQLTDVPTAKMRLMGAVFTEEQARIADAILKSGKQMQWVGRQMLVGVTLPVVGATAVLAAFGLKLAREQTELQKYIGTGTQAAASLTLVKDKIEELSAALGINQAELTNTASLWAAAGFTDPHVLNSVTQLTAELQTLTQGDLDLNGAMLLIRSTMSVFHKNITDQGQAVRATAADMKSLQAIQSTTAITMTELAQAIPLVATSATRLGLSIGEVGAILAGMRQQGIGATDGANALKVALIRMVNPTQAASKAWAELNGNTLKSFLFDNQGRAKGIQGLKDFAAAFENLNQEQQISIAGQVFQSRQAVRLMAAIDELNNANSDTSKALKISNNETQAAAYWNNQLQVILAGSAKQWDKLKVSAEIAAAKLGQEILPYLLKIGDAIRDIIVAFSNAPKGIQAFVFGMAAVAASIGPAIYAMGQFELVYANVRKLLLVTPLRAMFQVTSIEDPLGLRRIAENTNNSALKVIAGMPMLHQAATLSAEEATVAEDLYVKALAGEAGAINALTLAQARLIAVRQGLVASPLPMNETGQFMVPGVGGVNDTFASKYISNQLGPSEIAALEAAQKQKIGALEKGLQESIGTSTVFPISEMFGASDLETIAMTKGKTISKDTIQGMLDEIAAQKDMLATIPEKLLATDTVASAATVAGATATTAFAAGFENATKATNWSRTGSLINAITPSSPLKGFWSDMLQGGKDTTTKLSGMFEKLGKDIPAFLRPISMTMAVPGGAGFTAISAVLENSLAKFVLFGTVLVVVLKHWKDLWAGMQPGIDAAKNTLAPVFERLTKALSDFFGGMTKGQTTSSSFFVSVGNMLGTIIEKLALVAKAISVAFGGAVVTIIQLAVGTFQTLLAILVGIVDILTGNFSDGMNALGESMGKMGEHMSAMTAVITKLIAGMVLLWAAFKAGAIIKDLTVTFGTLSNVWKEASNIASFFGQNALKTFNAINSGAMANQKATAGMSQAEKEYAASINVTLSRQALQVAMQERDNLLTAEGVVSKEALAVANEEVAAAATALAAAETEEAAALAAVDLVNPFLAAAVAIGAVVTIIGSLISKSHQLSEYTKAYQDNIDNLTQSFAELKTASTQSTDTFTEKAKAAVGQIVAMASALSKVGTNVGLAQAKQQLSEVNNEINKISNNPVASIGGYREIIILQEQQKKLTEQINAQQSESKDVIDTTVAALTKVDHLNESQLKIVQSELKNRIQLLQNEELTAQIFANIYKQQIDSGSLTGDALKTAEQQYEIQSTTAQVYQTQLNLLNGISSALAQNINVQDAANKIRNWAANLGQQAGATIGTGISGGISKAMQSALTNQLTEQAARVSGEIIAQFDAQATAQENALAKADAARMAAFDANAKKQTDAIDAQIKNLQDLNSTQQWLLQQEQYRAQREQLIQTASLNSAINYRQRLLAIDTGQYDQARILALQGIQQAAQSKNDINTLDQNNQQAINDRNNQLQIDALNQQKDLLQQQLDAQKQALQDQLTAQEAALSAQLDAQRTALQNQLDLITEFGANNEKQWNKMWDNLQQAAKDGGVNITGLFKKFKDDWGFSITDAFHFAWQRANQQNATDATQAGKAVVGDVQTGMTTADLSTATNAQQALQAFADFWAQNMINSNGLDETDEVTFMNLYRKYLASLQKKHSGGYISAYPGANNDGEKPIMAQIGEYVLPRRTTAMIGTHVLDKMTRFHDGGLVDWSTVGNNVVGATNGIGKTAAYGLGLGTALGTSTTGNMLLDMVNALGKSFAKGLVDQVTAIPPGGGITGKTAGGLTFAEQNFKNIMFSKFSGLINMGELVIKKVQGLSIWSQHAYGNAIDIGRPGAPNSLTPLWNYIIGNTDPLSIAHVIFNHKAWSWNASGDHIGPYTSTSNPHVDHIHTDFLPQYAGNPPGYPIPPYGQYRPPGSGAPKVGGDLGTPNPSSSVSNWYSTAMSIAGKPLGWAPDLETIGWYESRWNPNAYNKTATSGGYHAEGIMQTIPPTFNAYAMSGHNSIYNAVDNIIAASRYIASRYGSPSNTPGIISLSQGGGYKGYGTGAFWTRPALIAERGSEMALPMGSPQAKAAYADLLEGALKIMGSNKPAPPAQINVTIQGNYMGDSVSLRKFTEALNEAERKINRSQGQPQQVIISRG